MSYNSILPINIDKLAKVGLKDIAEQAGVSIALVSYVLNGQAVQKQVNHDTAIKIKQVAKELNYQPNQIAKSLKTNKTRTIGLVVADINYRFSTGITRAIEIEAKKNHLTVIYGSSNENRENLAELITTFINHRVEGLIVVPVDNSQEEIRMIQRADIPFILVDRNFPELETNYITLDNYKAAYNATKHLISLGHRKISFINYSTTSFHLKERNRGYMDALKDHQIKFNKNWLQEVSNSNRDEEVPVAMNAILSLDEPCDAVFFATDTLTLNGLKYLIKHNIKVPDQISVLSFDESEAFELFYSSITHSRQPLDDMGKLAVKNLLNLINHKKIEMHVHLEASLVLGDSCYKK